MLLHITVNGEGACTVTSMELWGISDKRQPYKVVKWTSKKREKVTHSHFQERSFSGILLVSACYWNLISIQAHDYNTLCGKFSNKHIFWNNGRHKIIKWTTK